MYQEKIVEKQDVIHPDKPKYVQDVIPVKKVYQDGMFKISKDRYSATYYLKDIDYADKKENEQKNILGKWSDILNSFEYNSTYKITICNRRVNVREEVNKTFLRTDYNDSYDYLRQAYNSLRWDDIKADNGFKKEKYITVSGFKKNAEAASMFFKNKEIELNSKLRDIGSSVKMMSSEERLRCIHDFFRCGNEEDFNFTYSKDNAKYFKNYVCPDSIKIKPDDFEVNDKFGRSFILRTWSDYIDDDFFNNLSDMLTNMMVSIDIIPFSIADSKRFINEKEDSVEFNAYQWSVRPFSKGNSVVRMPKWIINDREKIDEWNTDVNKRNQKVFFCQISVVMICDTKEELEKNTESIINTANEKTSTLGTLWHQQLEGIWNTLPFGIRCIENLRDCNTETTAIMLPFKSVQINHTTGIPYGRHILTRQQQFVDRRTQANGHSFILGESGYGKSMNEKDKIFNTALLTDMDIVVCDPDGEYSPIINALGGKIVNIGEDELNIMDINNDYDDKDPVKKKSNFILTLVETILGRENFGEIEKSICDRCVRLLFEYKKNGQFSLPPTWFDWYVILSQQPEPQAQKIALSIERHITGSFNCFSGHNTVDRSSRFLCYNLSTLPKQLKDAGMLICLDEIDQRLISNRYKNRFTNVVFDEADYYFKHRTSLSMIEDFFERARKYNGIIDAIIQDISKVILIPEARTMINNCDNVIMMHQAELPALELKNMFNLSENQYNFLLNAEPGTGINKIGNLIYSFDGRIPKDNPIYDLISTDGARGNKNG